MVQVKPTESLPPFPSLTDMSTLDVLAVVGDPLIRPLFVLRFNPFGKPAAENVSESLSTSVADSWSETDSPTWLD